MVYVWDNMPSCHNLIVELCCKNLNYYRIVYPLITGRQVVPLGNVPSNIAADYREACQVLDVSPKASAAITRRCLQGILRDQGYMQKDLVQQIKAVLTESDPRKGLPQSLYETVDAVRNFGNFSAHPMNDTTSLQVIDVDPEEAEWCLEIVEQLFEHFYDRPAAAAAKKAALNAKLEAAGKPPAL